MNRSRRRLAIAGMGAGVSLLMGSGLFALTSDTIRSPGNNAQSGTFAAVTSHDLKWARVAAPSDCNPGSGTVYADGPMSALIVTGGSANIDLQAGTGTTNHDIICVENAGTRTGRLVAAFNTTADVEVGSCQTTEASAGDSSCADASAGELRPVLNSFFSLEDGDPGCDASAGTAGYSSWEGAGRVIGAQLESGDYCAYMLVVSVERAATDSQKLVAQTDRVQFDVNFTLSDLV